METENICKHKDEAEKLSDDQPSTLISKKNPDHSAPAEAQLHSNKLEDAFKVPTIPKMKPAFSKPPLANSNTSSVATSAEHSVATVTGTLSKTSVENTSQDGLSSDGFTIPNSVAPRLPATSLAKQSRGPTLPPPKATSPRERAGGGTAPAAYRPPAWSGCPPEPFSLEVLRGGQIVDTVSLEGRPCVVFGRLADCDVRLEHPSISRHHAALVYRASGDDGHETGYYLYDLGSTHGSTLNKTPVQPKVYCRMRVGHMCKFGGSTRLFILQGPEEDREEESELTVTELKELGQKREEERQERLERQQERMEALDDKEQEPEPEPKRITTHTVADDGISWGMGEDADEETDIQFNPFALGEAENEQLYLIDPKRTLRGWFEREGHELEYQTEELPGGRHVCRITLPLDTADGVPPVAEVQHVGKKKEAVFQCAQEACRMLDRAGVLRQAKQESRQKVRRKPAGYDSDEDDTFLDRTGAVERKRQRRQQGGQTQQKAETYQELLAQYQRVQSEAGAVDRRLQQMQSAAAQAESGADGDELDAFMTRLSQGAFSDRQEKRQLRTRLSQLRTEEGRLCKLVNLARPAALPPLKPPPQVAAARAPLTGFIGRRRGKAGPGATRAAPVTSSPDQHGPRRDDRKGPEEADSASGQPRESAADRLSPGADCTPDSTTIHQQGADPKTDTDSVGGPNGTAVSRGKARSDRDQPSDDVRTAATEEVPRSAATDRTTAGRTESPQPGGEEPEAKRKRQPGKQRRKEGQAAAVSYSELAGDGCYDVWVPPEGQSGDGRTSLNDKLGY